MENATKALLIAASVLIVILLIAFGMNIFKSVDDTTSGTGDVANAIGTGTTDATNDAMTSMGYKWNETDKKWTK